MRFLLACLLLVACDVDGFVVHEGSNLFRSLPKLWASAADEVQRLREEADRLRQEVAAFQHLKFEAEEKRRDAEKKSQDERKEVINRYSAEVPIFKEDGSTVMERVNFSPWYNDGSSRIVVVEAALPMAILLGESENFPGAISVDEVAGGGNGELAGVKEGDLLRACTACQSIMEAPTWQILAGGIGMPKTKRLMYSVDRRPFEEVMGAVGSNRMDPDQRPAVLVLEKRDYYSYR